eukprot:TRINITY_DN5546_c0_g1_i1.p1 TRINITY_DN5546_c0_g1~~TRINITY_DN5546_c0_g1_i1.p1  ORF type:complete len:407 (+),score=76.30 TRINITY_DN5546_c0_g1_i1:389-1609(+)
MFTDQHQGAMIKESQAPQVSNQELQSPGTMKVSPGGRSEASKSGIREFKKEKMAAQAQLRDQVLALQVAPAARDEQLRPLEDSNEQLNEEVLSLQAEHRASMNGLLLEKLAELEAQLREIAEERDRLKEAAAVRETEAKRLVEQIGRQTEELANLKAVSERLRAANIKITSLESQLEKQALHRADLEERLEQTWSRHLTAEDGNSRSATENTLDEMVPFYHLKVVLDRLRSAVVQISLLESQLEEQALYRADLEERLNCPATLIQQHPQQQQQPQQEKRKNRLLEHIVNGGPEKWRRALVEAIRSSAHRLDLSGNNIGNHGAKAVANALEDNTSLLEINLGRNSIGNAGFAELMYALQQNLILRNIHLAGNCYDKSEATLKINELRAKRREELRGAKDLLEITIDP